MKKETLIRLVKAEAKAILENAMVKERNKLDFENLNETCHTKCIYGQMTNSCFSKRASSLINKCAPKLLTGSIGTITSDLQYVNGVDITKDTKRKADEDLKPNTKYWSPIEMFIAHSENSKNGNTKNLVAYLKGETKKLELKVW